MRLAPIHLAFVILASCSSKSSPPFCGLGAPPPGIGVEIAVGAPCCPAIGYVSCLDQGDETSGCPVSGTVVECLYAGAEAGSPNGGAPIDATCKENAKKYTWQKVFTCPHDGVCGGGAALESFGILQCISSNSSAPVPLAGSGGWCSGEGDQACSLDQTELLECDQGLWMPTEGCPGRCGLTDPSCRDIVCPVGCLK